MLDYNEGDAGAEQADAPGEDAAAANLAETDAAAGGAPAAMDAEAQGADAEGAAEVQPTTTEVRVRLSWCTTVPVGHPVCAICVCVLGWLQLLDTCHAAR